VACALVMITEYHVREGLLFMGPVGVRINPGTAFSHFSDTEACR
jgi:hypothetical protein